VEANRVARLEGRSERAQGEGPSTGARGFGLQAVPLFIDGETLPPGPQARHQLPQGSPSLRARSSWWRGGGTQPRGCSVLDQRADLEHLEAFTVGRAGIFALEAALSPQASRRRSARKRAKRAPEVIGCG